MKTPNDGLRVLKNILKPGGYLKLGLYSELARKFVVKMKDYIKLKNYSDTAEDMKKFRNDIFNFQENNISYDIASKIFLSNCFWNLSGVRDLIFHTQEYTFTIPEIEKFIKSLKLEFCGFENKEIVNLFKKVNKYPEDLYNLNLWGEFENNNPRIFAGMYQFWCQKK